MLNKGPAGLHPAWLMHRLPSSPLLSWQQPALLATLFAYLHIVFYRARIDGNDSNNSRRR